jgi:hypothetical protein
MPLKPVASWNKKYLANNLTNNLWYNLSFVCQLFSSTYVICMHCTTFIHQQISHKHSIKKSSIHKLSIHKSSIKNNSISLDFYSMTFDKDH